MKKRLCTLMVCLATVCGMVFIACQKENPIVNPVEDSVTDSITDSVVDPVEEYSILGRWMMNRATQYVGGNEVDLTPWYDHFCLIFEEDGTLITYDGINEVPMRWTLDGDQLAFIQVEGMDPVMYTVKKLTQDELVIENGTGTDYVTVMEFDRLATDN